MLSLPERNFFSLCLCLLVVIPEGNLLFLLPLPFFLSFPKGICCSALMTNMACLLSAPALSITSNHAVLLATVGTCLIFAEFNRPGRVLPAAAGLLLVLFAVAALLRTGLQPWAAALLLCSAAVFLLNLWRALPPWSLVLVTLLTMGALRFLVPSGHGSGVQTPVAVLCGGLLGGISAVLTRVAYRARRAKALD